jgi:hypothetical protein
MSQVDTLSERERAKYEQMWAFPEYRDDHVTAHAREAVAAMGARPGESIIDFGSGAGYASAWLQREGFEVLAMDIAANAMAPELRGRIPILLGSLWRMPVEVHADWGFCGDVMEHIPTDRVADVLRFIRASTRRATWFCISIRPDGCGVLIGETLHLTVQDGDWWTAQLRTHWPEVRVLEHQPGERIVLVAEGGAKAPAAAGAADAVLAVYTERMSELAQRMAASGVRDLLVFGAADAGRALARVAPDFGLRVHAFVRSDAAIGETVDGLPVWSLADAAMGVCHTYAIGSFGSAPAMLTAIEAVYAGRACRYRVHLPEGPAPAITRR